MSITNELSIHIRELKRFDLNTSKQEKKAAAEELEKKEFHATIQSGIKEISRLKKNHKITRKTSQGSVDKAVLYQMHHHVDAMRQACEANPQYKSDYKDLVEAIDKDLASMLPAEDDATFDPEYNAEIPEHSKVEDISAEKETREADKPKKPKHHISEDSILAGVLGSGAALFGLGAMGVMIAALASPLIIGMAIPLLLGCALFAGLALLVGSNSDDNYH